MKSNRFTLTLWIFILTPQYGDFSMFQTGSRISGCRLDNTETCTGHIVCKWNMNNFNAILENWNCIQQTTYYHDYYRRPFNNNNYKLELSFEHMDDSTAWNEMQSYINHIILFNLEGGNLKSVPTIINQMAYIKEFKLSDNKIEVLVLSNFMNKQEMTKMNLSHNAITTIDIEYTDTPIHNVDALSTLDLSYNLIESLPKKCFEYFGKLKNIDLSHNNIKSLDIFTFLGLTEINTLNLSYNKLSTIGHAFVRFVTLKYLSIDHNQIATFLESNLISMVNLEKINASYNEIENIETVAFRSLSSLRSLDLSHNRIKIVKESLFENTTNLETLHFADNEIEVIEPGAFKRTKITDFSIEKNRISGTISKNTLAGVQVANLTITKSKIENLEDFAFCTLNSSLVSLNLSTNTIKNISKLAFKSLTLLSILDLSHNNISELDFDTSDTKNLSALYVHNNRITKIYKSVFANLSSLVELDLSHNVINEIELNAFDSLSKLKKLLLNNNDLTNAIDSYSFRRLVAITRIDFTDTKITIYNNETFSNMISLTTFISSNGQLTAISYNAFLGTGSITKLDLSYNLLNDFCVNTTTISGVISLYLNNNNLMNITNSTFYGLKSLQTLNLSSNNIINVEGTSFQGLTSLFRLDLSSNLDVDLASNAFDNLKWLEEVYLSNIRKKFNFINATNTSMSTLIMSKHHIDNINDIFVFHVKNVDKIDLSANKITYVDKYSFQKMESLTWLDLSCNMITDIQPGSFSHMHMINDLNLHDNQIQTLQYGVLDGCENLRKLNLSYNALHNFEVNVLHTAPFLETISLDNNAIKSLSFRAFSKTQIKVIYLGGNPIQCSILVDLKLLGTLDFTVTAEKLDYNSENVHGVSCKTSVTDVLHDVYNTSDVNMTSMFRTLAKTVVDLQETLKNVANHTEIKEDILTNTLSDVSKAVNVLATSYNSLQNANERNLNTFFRVLNETDYRNRNNNSASINFGNMSDILKEYLNPDFQKRQQENSEGEVKYQDIKFLLYVIAVCLVCTLIAILGVVLYIFVLRRNAMRLLSSPSIQPIIGNSMEMD